ncbi:MAG: hypothetical protein ACHQ1D_05740 [Nitrososphaerales archaeon]
MAGGSNVARHISRKHGDYDVPVLTEFRRTDLPHQGSYRPYFPDPRLNFAKKALEKKEKDFISSYKFEDKKLEIFKKFLEAQKLPQSDEIRLIIQDLMLQMERAVSSSTYPSGRDLNKKMAS